MKVPIRYDGYLNEVGDEEELRSFEESRDDMQIPRTLFSKTKYSEPTRADSPFGDFAPPSTSTSMNHSTNGSGSVTSSRNAKSNPSTPRYPNALSRTRESGSSTPTPTPSSASKLQRSGAESGGLGRGSSNALSRIVTRHNSPSQHALALLNERARLKAELAQIKARRGS